MSTASTPHPGRVDDAGLPPQVRLLLTGVALVVLAVVCDAAGLRGAAATVLFLGAVLAGSLHSRPAFTLLTAFAAWAVLTGFVTGHDGVLRFGDGRWRELLLFGAAALLTCVADRVRRTGAPR